MSNAVTKDFMANLFSVEGKVVVLTGATGSMGNAFAKAYAYAGAKIVLTGRNEKRLGEISQKVKDIGGDCAIYVGDPAKEDDVQGLVKFAVDTYGEINILCLTHGYNVSKGILDQSVAEWQYIMDADCKSVYIVSKYIAEQMVKQGKGGKIVVTSSQRSKAGMVGYTAYCASKAAVDLMIQSMACDLTAPHKINVNTFNPALSRSEITEWMFDEGCEVNKNMLKRMSVGRLAEPHDFIGLVMLLSSAASDFLTGGNYDATGGYWSC